MRPGLFPVLFPAAPLGALALIAREAQGLGIDFTDSAGLGLVAVRDTTTSANNLYNAPVDSFLSQSGTSPKLVLWSDGLYRWTGHNLHLVSEIQSGWLTGNGTLTANSLGTMALFTENTLTGAHTIFASAAPANVVAGATYAGRVRLGAGTLRYVQVQILATAQAVWVTVDTQSWTIVKTAAEGSSTYLTSSIAAVGDGTYDISVSGVAGAVVAGYVVTNGATAAADAVVPSYLGTSATWYVGRVQLNRGTVPTAYHVTLASAWYGVPIEYDPTTGKYYALVEPQVTNLIIQNTAFDNVAWDKGSIGLTAPVVTANLVAGPLGDLDADRIVFPAVSGAGNTSRITPAAPIAVTAVPYAFSVFLKGAAGGEQIYLYATPDGITFLRTRVTLTTSWQRFTLTGTPTAVAWSFAIGADLRDGSQTATSALTLYAWGAQLETGSVATSPIFTAAATVTRSADSVNVATSAFPYSATASTLIAVFTPKEAGGALDHYAAELAKDTNDRMSLGSNNAGFWLGATGGVGQFTPTAGTATANVQIKVAGAAAANDAVLVVNGGTPATDTSVTMPAAATQLNLGYYTGNANYLNGRLSSVVYLPRRMTNAELQARTAP